MFPCMGRVASTAGTSVAQGRSARAGQLDDRSAAAVTLLLSIRCTTALAEKQALVRTAGWEPDQCHAGAAALEVRARARALVEVGRNLGRVNNPGRSNRGVDFHNALRCLGLRDCQSITGRVDSRRARDAIEDALQMLLDSAATWVDVLDGDSGFQPLQGVDLRGSVMPPQLARSVLERVNLAGEELRGRSLSGSIFRSCDLRGVGLPADLQDVQLIDCDLRGAQVGIGGMGKAAATRARAGTSPAAWPDFSAAQLMGAVLDFSEVVRRAGADRLAPVGHLLDASKGAGQRSVLRSVHSIADTQVKADAMQRVLEPLQSLLAAREPGSRLFDAFFGDSGGGPPEARLRYVASLAAVMFDPVYTGEGAADIEWLRSELASEVAEHARFYHGNAAALVTLSIHRQAFPQAMRELALEQNPDLAW